MYTVSWTSRRRPLAWRKRAGVERREGWWRKNEASLFFLFSQRVGEATYRIRHEGAFLAPLSLLSTYYARITKLSQSSSRPSTARINYVVRSGCGKKNLRTRLSRKKNLNYTFFLIPTSGNFLLPRANISRRRFALQKGEEGESRHSFSFTVSFPPPHLPYASSSPAYPRGRRATVKNSRGR